MLVLKLELIIIQTLAMSSLVLLFLLCLPLHACNARHLGIIYKETGRSRNYFLGEDLEEPKPHKASIPLVFRPSITEELLTQKGQQVGANNQGKIQERRGRANPMKHKCSYALLTEDDDTKVATSGNMVSSREVLQQATKLERQARSLLESTPHDAEETIDSKENKVVEDIVAMDYAGPHQKPPIHNRDP